MHLRNKSESNIASAELLIEESFYASSVHCSYYGAYQFSKTTLNRIGMTYTDLNRETTIAKTKGIGSHDFLISKITQKYKEKTSPLDARDLKNDFKLLKSYRHISDYDNELVDSTKSNEALRISQEIIKRIKKI